MGNNRADQAIRMNRRPIIQKTLGRKQQKLRDSAKACPRCMGCGLENNCGTLLCLAHSNRLIDGKGRGIKATDASGAILCDTCHSLVDGRAGNLTREQSQAFHQRAHQKTHAWWVKEGLVK